VAAALLAAVAAAPLRVGAADHLDAPGLTSPDGITELDINDLYVFEGSPGKTVLAATVSPLASADSDLAQGFSKAYSFRIDTDGDAVEDVTYHVRAPLSLFGTQKLLVQRSTGRSATSLQPNGGIRGIGVEERAFGLRHGGRAFAGLRSDPFFFDLSGFLGTVEGQGEDALGQDPTDFFDGVNILAIVLEVPDSELNDGGPISAWATTTRRDGGSWRQVDRMGRPAINTVVNSSGPIVGAPTDAKNAFNAGRPADDVADFRPAVIAALQAYSSLDVEGAYADAEAGALADVLLPDVLTFDKASTQPAPLNGRALADDVIDTELRIVTGGDPLGLFPGRDADGAINGDGVGPHDDYQDRFPYLGRPVTG
jgi:hypothetical protein